MPAFHSLISFLVEWRLDSIGVCTFTLALCAGSRAYVRRQTAAPDFPTVICVAVVILALAGALLAEWTGLVIGFPGTATFRLMVISRLFVLGAATLLGGGLLWATVQLAVLRGRLRSRADTERQLQEAKIAADEANRAKSDFLAVMSHEIRTPLNAVMGFAKLLSETRLEEVQRSYISTITSEGERLASLINDLLDLTKIEGGQLVLERVPFAPAETSHEVLQLLGARAMEKKVELRFEAQLADPLLVAGDPLRFRQILVNLVDNAIKFTPGGSVTVFLSWTPPNGSDSPGRLSVSVRDNGIGIAVEKQKSLFQMFMQADSSTSRKYGGTGLGLAICQRLVRLMGGEIVVTSALGQGSEFSFWLPLPVVALPGRSKDEIQSDPPFPRKPRVLIVDDMETNRFLLVVFLRKHGFEPEVATGGEEAIRLAAASRYDAILMDLQMPEVDGYTASRRIRETEPPGQHTPIIALTASIAKGTREKCLAAGMDEYLAKPLDLDRFKKVLRSHVSAQIASRS